MEFTKTKFDGVFLIKPQVFGDSRGFFLESYSKKKFEEAGIAADFVQDNHSRSAEKGVLRGLHFQKPPFAQAKLVWTIKGKILDAVVDLRKDSDTFGQWEGFELSAENFLMLFVPRGFAHGFCVLEEGTEVMYKTDNYYAPEHDSGLLWNDQTLKIDWPVKEPILSEKDQKQQVFEEFIKNNPF